MTTLIEGVNYRVTFEGKGTYSGNLLAQNGDEQYPLSRLALSRAVSIERLEPDWQVGDVAVLQDGIGPITLVYNGEHWASSLGSRLQQDRVDELYNQGRLTLVLRNGKVV